MPVLVLLALGAAVCDGASAGFALDDGLPALVMVVVSAGFGVAVGLHRGARRWPGRSRG